MPSFPFAALRDVSSGTRRVIRQPGHHDVANRDQRVELRRRETVDHVAAHRVDVQWRGIINGSAAVVGEHDECAAGVRCPK